jgi:hypothetical protein
MFEILRLQLYGQFTEERLWGLVLLALSLAVALPVGYYMLGRWVGWMQYVAAAGGFVVALIFAGQVFGKVLSRVRKRWFA